LELIVDPAGWLEAGDRRVRCALGRAGVRVAKREGDGATPAGLFPLRAVYFRPDRLRQPRSGLPTLALGPNDGWCDDPADIDYNRFVRLPHPGSHERLWRDDRLYDVFAVIGYNDAPPVPGLGSAIFLHVATADFAPTEGCVAVAQDALVEILAACDPGSTIRITAPG
jgi:L,D-peptidoglycan transpeptidase YkuD (ErfK/YbiS/YcfS/YnhG family)